MTIERNVDLHPGTGRFPWLSVLAIVFGVALVRVILLLVLPYELVGDEAHYWEWSRRLELSYYSKGPAVAHLIAASTALLGNEEWAVRLPSVLCSAVMMLAMGCLGWSVSGANRRAAVACAAASLVVPAYHATALLMTIDAPLLACWAVATTAAWIVLQRWRGGRGALLPTLLLALALGAGFLAKYTIALLVPGLVVGMWRGFAASRARMRIVMELCTGAVVLVVVCSPVILWNAQHGWPTVAHLLGHLGAPGGDLRPSPGESWEWSARWALEFAASQVLLIGPALALMILTVVRKNEGLGIEARRAHSFLIACAMPILIFYLTVSLVTDAEGNWPIAGYVTLLVLVAARAPVEFDRFRSLLREWKSISPAQRTRSGIFRRRPETWFQILSHWSMAYGIGGLLVLVLLFPLSRVPLVGGLVPVDRLRGGRAAAARVDEIRRGMSSSVEPVRLVVADRYDRASLLAYYLPGQPRVWCASSALGDRRTAYDFFPDTRLSDPQLQGAEVVLVGSGVKKWRRGLDLSDLQTVDATIPAHVAVFIAVRRVEQAP